MSSVSASTPLFEIGSGDGLRGRDSEGPIGAGRKPFEAGGFTQSWPIEVGNGRPARARKIRSGARTWRAFFFLALSPLSASMLSTDAADGDAPVSLLE